MQSSLPEVRANSAVCHESIEEDHIPWTKFSSFKVAWCRRFGYNYRAQLSERILDPVLTPEEILYIQHVLLQLAQDESFPGMVAAFQEGKKPSGTKSLLSLEPFLGKDMLIRVGGRLKHSGLPETTIHPILLLRTHYLSQRLVEDIHQMSSHAGPSTMMAILSETYCIIGVKRLVRSISKSCVICQRTYLRTMSQQMGQLPKSRTVPNPPFTITGVDFAGPFMLKRGNPCKPTHIKAYVALFICFTTKATHLEVCEDLSTRCFLAALSRFTDRRGCPSQIYSDNGTNFQGTANKLTEFHQLLQCPDFKRQSSHLTSKRRIVWKFSPPRASHYGGLWESSIKSMKLLLKKNVQGYILTVPEFTTIVVNVEATLNSRPLELMDSNPTDGTVVLTPGHFLIGRPLRALPLAADTTTSRKLLKRWDLVQRISTDFWRQWRSRYLQSLQSRSKWKTPSPNVKVGDIVVLKDETLFDRTWPLALVIAVYPGKDGLVRYAEVRCREKTYRRSINRLVLLFSAKDQIPSSLPPEHVQALQT